MTFEARGATTVKLLFYSRNTYMADSLLGGCVVDLGARPEFSLGAPRPLVEKSWFSLEPEKRPTGPEDFLYRHRTALGSVEVSASRLPGTLSHRVTLLSHRSTGPRSTFPKVRASKEPSARGDARPFHGPLPIIS